MAARLRSARSVAVSLVAGALVLGCGINPAETPPPSGPLPTSMESLSPAVAGTWAALDAALRSRAALGLDDAPEGYRPSEPPSLAYVPRSVAKVRLPNDPNRLYVVFYALPDATTAESVGRDAAAYYASGPALVQFPADTRFALSQVGEILVFSAWSPSLTSDPATAGAAFDVIRSFGQVIPVSR